MLDVQVDRFIHAEIIFFNFTDDTKGHRVLLRDPSKTVNISGGRGYDYPRLILTEQKERVTKLLEENRDVVIGLRDSLIARDELVGDEIMQQIELVLDSRNPAAR